ncbi:MAG: hypothetical protein NC349_03040 [Paenibacillus sp.]|nr:hypothetical protein [Paenibacillus sp.]
MKHLSLLTLALAIFLPGKAELVTYPAGPGVETLDDFTVEVRQGAETPWQSVAVYPVKVDEVRGTKHTPETASMAYFDFDGTVDVRVIAHRAPVTEARVRPLSYNITPAVSGDTLTFSLSSPRNLSVEVNGDIFHNLHLFANPIDTHRPSAKVLKNLKKHKDLIYFAPGVHNLPGDTLSVPSGTTVYIDGGARVYGQLIANGVSDVKFYGRGEVHPRGRGEGVYIKRSKNIEADGIIVTQIPVGGSDSVSINNVKAISYYGWGDGMNVFASDNVHYNNVFCRNSDDCNTVYATRKGFNGGCRNITMENSTLWADVAHPIMIGLHGSAAELGTDAPADTIQNLMYRNIDILDHQEKQIDYQGCFAINCGDNNLVKDITFDNIRVEDFRQGQLFNIRIFFNEKYCKAPGTCVKNVLFRDVVYNGSGDELSIIAGYNQDRKVSDITFENLVINGEKISDDMPGKPKWYKTGDMARIFIGEHVDNVKFISR